MPLGNKKKLRNSSLRKNNKLESDMGPTCIYVYHNLYHRQKYISLFTT